MELKFEAKTTDECEELTNQYVKQGYQIKWMFATRVKEFMFEDDYWDICFYK